MATAFARTDGHLDTRPAESLRSTVRDLRGWWPSRDVAPERVDQPFVIAEINALIHHATENGLDPDGTIIGPLYQAALRYQGLDAGRRASDEGAACAAEILRLYTQLCGLPELKGISGRTLLYAHSVTRHIRGLLGWGVLFVLLGAGTEAVLLQSQPASPTDAMAPPGWLPAFIDVRLLSCVNPFFWGGVGACVFLVKSLNDKARELTFDRLRMHGLGARIFLGAVLGALLANGIGVDSATGGFTTAGVAFLGGLGVKAIYAAFEALVDGFHDRIAGARPQASAGQ